MTTQAICKELTLIFSRFTYVDRVVLFGSRALGTERENSDIDIAVYGKEKKIISLACIFMIKDVLEAESSIPYHFDVIDGYGIDSKELQRHIEMHGREVYHRLTS